ALPASKGLVLGVVGFGTAAAGETGRLAASAPFVAGGPVATHCLLIAERNGGAPIAACVDLERAGASRGPLLHSLGFDRAPACALEFDHVALEGSTALQSEAA